MDITHLLAQCVVRRWEAILAGVPLWKHQVPFWFLGTTDQMPDWRKHGSHGVAEVAANTGSATICRFGLRLGGCHAEYDAFLAEVEAFGPLSDDGQVRFVVPEEALRHCAEGGRVTTMQCL